MQKRFIKSLSVNDRKYSRMNKDCPLRLMGVSVQSDQVISGAAATISPLSFAIY